MTNLRISKNKNNIHFVIFSHLPPFGDNICFIRSPDSCDSSFIEQIIIVYIHQIDVFQEYFHLIFKICVIRAKSFFKVYKPASVPVRISSYLIAVLATIASDEVVETGEMKYRSGTFAWANRICRSSNFRYFSNTMLAGFLVIWVMECDNFIYIEVTDSVSGSKSDLFLSRRKDKKADSFSCAFFVLFIGQYCFAKQYYPI
jgi:hypothetical protein